MNPNNVLEGGFFDFELYDLQEPADFFSLSGMETFPTLINNAKIALVYSKESDNSEIHDFLAKILAAAGQKMEEVAAKFPILPDETYRLAAFLRRFCPATRLVLVFGIPAAQLGLWLEHNPYQPTEVNHTTYIFADSVQAIFEERQQGGKKMSSALWLSLKQYFQV